MTTNVATAESGTNGNTVATTDTGSPAWDAVSIGAGGTFTYANTGGCLRGSLCYAYSLGATAGNSYVEWNVNAGGATSVQYHRLYLDPADFSGAPILARGLDSTGATQRWRLVYSAGTVVLRDSANSVVFTSSALTSGTRYRVEWQVEGTATGAVRLLVYVGESGTATYDSGASTGNFGGNIQRVRFGQASSGSSVSGKFDDAGWSDTAALGAAVHTSGTVALVAPVLLAASGSSAAPPSTGVVTGVITSTVEVALGADLSADPTTWTWTDVTSSVRGSAQVGRGRPDRANTQPAQCSLRLDNTDSRFTPRHGLSPYFGQWGQGTPLRVKLDPGTGSVVRFQGYVASVAPVWPAGNSDYAEVAVTAAGALRRLSQGAVLRSAVVRAALSPAPVAAWGLDGDSQATAAANLVSGGSPLAPSGTVTFGVADTALPGAATVATMPSGTTMTAQLASWTSTGFIGINFWVKLFTTPGDGAAVNLVKIQHGAGARLIWIQAADSGNVSGPSFDVVGFDFPTGTTSTLNSKVGIGTPGVTLNPFDGNWHNVFVSMAQSGANVNWALYCDGTLADSATITGLTLAAIPAITYGNAPVPGGTTGTASFSALTIWSDSTATNTHAAGTAYAGELASARVTRLCGEEGVPATVTGTSTVTMGAQTAKTFVDLLRECEAVDQGVIRDGLTAGITYLAGPSRYNATVGLALDTARRHVKLPFGPIDDDARTRNDITASRPNGSTARVVNSDPNDPLSTVRAGVYSDQVTVNVETDGQLADQAGWRVHGGTLPEMRVPTLPIMPTDTPELITSWLACDIGTRYTMTNPPAQFPADLDQVLEAYRETFDKTVWSVQLTGSPAAAWRVGEIEGATYTLRLETDGSTLAAGVTSTDTTWSVATTGTNPLWTTTATYPADFPFDLDVEGEQVTVTAIVGASSPQTFTVTRSVNGVVKAHASATAITLWQQPVLAL